MTKVAVFDSNLSIVYKDNLTTGTESFFKVQYVFNETWDNYKKYAVFFQVITEPKLEIEIGETNIVEIPNELLFTDLPLFIGAYGINKDDGSILSSNFKSVPVLYGAFTGDIISLENQSVGLVRTLDTKIKYIRVDNNGNFQYTTDGKNWINVTDFKGIAVHKLTKTDLNASDDIVLTTITSPKSGDIALISTIVNSITYELSAYIRNKTNTAWEAITGNVDADKVIIRENIKLAGNYTSVGNISKGSNKATLDYETQGMSVADLFKEILSQRVQPSITENPFVSGFTLTNAKAVEAGTTLTSVSFSGAVFNDGAYTYEEDTGAGDKSLTWLVYRVTRSGSATTDTIGTTVIANTNASSTDNNGGEGFVIGDNSSDGSFSKLAYKIVASYSAGNVAKDNLGDPSSPAIQIPSGTKNQTTSAYTSFRNYFMGSVDSANPPSTTSITSAFIRDTIKKNGAISAQGAYSSGAKTLIVPAGSTGVYIACPSTNTGVTKIFNNTINTDVTSMFTKQGSISINGANGYSAITYNVWYYIPKAAYSSEATFTVTLG